MSEMHDSLQIAKELAPYVFGVGAAFWVKKWIGRTDDSIQELVKSVQAINVQLAVHHEHRQSRDETMTDLKKRVEQTEKDLGKINGSLSTYWSMLKGKAHACEAEPYKTR